MSKQITEITNLATAAHDLLQCGDRFNDRQRSRLFKTATGILERIDAAVADIETTGAIKAAMAGDAAPAAPAPAAQADGGVHLSPQELLGLNIAILGLPHALSKTLVRDKIFTVGELVAENKSGLERIPGVGQAGTGVIVKALARFNIELIE